MKVLDEYILNMVVCLVTNFWFKSDRKRLKFHGQLVVKELLAVS